MTDQDEPRKAISRLFDLAGIVRVVYVDDLYFHTAGIEEVIGFCGSVDPAFARSIAKLEPIAFDGDPAVWHDNLRQVWEELGDAEQVAIYRQLVSMLEKEKEEDLKNVNVLSELLSKYDFHGLSLNEWNDNRETLLRESTTKKTLFLFDRNLSVGGGTTDGGISLIQEVLNSPHHSNAVCGLISRTFSREEEYATWQDLTREHGLDKDSFVPISKERLMQEPISFARMLKLTILSKPCSNLRHRVEGIISNSLEEACKEVDSISVWDFEHIVFKASNREGIWEPDTLFRLFSMFHREATLRISRTDRDLGEIVGQIRSISDIAVDSEALPSETWKIQRREIYWDEAALNAHYLPIELGDIFETTNNSAKKYILLAQPCDLMVRPDGRRHKAVTEVFLAEILPNLPQKTKGQPAQYELYYELPYFDHRSPKSHYVGLRQKHAVRLSILDLCSYRTDGRATFGLDDTCPAAVIPAWRQHHEELKEYFRTALNGYLGLQAAMRAQNVTAQIIDAGTIPLSSHTNIFPFSVDSERRIIAYNCRRVGRLSAPRASALLTHFSAYMSRPAFDVDLGRSQKDEAADGNDSETVATAQVVRDK